MHSETETEENSEKEAEEGVNEYEYIDPTKQAIPHLLGVSTEK